MQIQNSRGIRRRLEGLKNLGRILHHLLLKMIAGAQAEEKQSEQMRCMER
jgi:hypothetical protein